jgi:hypothetical protein
VAAFTDPRHLDLGLAYRGGVEAWRTGHPEAVKTWMSTSFLALVMALVSRVSSEAAAARGITALNVGLVIATLGLVWGSLRGHVSKAFFWLSLAMASSFAPLISTVLYKQFNFIVLFLALLAFSMLTRGRPAFGAFLLSLSVCLKPIAVLLPLALLARAGSRRAGVLCLASCVALTALAQVFLAVRAGDPSALSPLPSAEGFTEKTERWLAYRENFSPRATLLRQTGPEEHGLTRDVALLGVLLMVLVGNEVTRERDGSSWEVFAFACLLSPLLSPVDWVHYQLLLAPMFLLLGYGFWKKGAPWPFWLVLFFSYGLCSLLLRPLGETIPAVVGSLFSPRRDPQAEINEAMAVAQYAPYVLFGLACLWFAPRRSGGRDAPSS